MASLKEKLFVRHSSWLALNTPGGMHEGRSDASFDGPQTLLVAPGLAVWI